jgi:AhpD family alkylhydroperoxidase
MHKDWKQLTGSLAGAMGELRKGAPDVARAFGGLAAAATADGALDKKTKELVALAISIALRCEGCIGFHTQAAKKAGASREEVLEIAGMAIYMGGGPSFVYAAQALEAYDQL